MKKIYKILIFILVFGVGAWFEKNANFSLFAPVEQESAFVEREIVEFCRVVDGDTIEVKGVNDPSFTIRLIGVNTPESVHVDDTKNCKDGEVASDFLKNYLKENCEDNTLYLEYDKELTDTYGRVLAYVYIDNDTMLQTILLSNGMAECMFVGENTKYKSIFIDTEKKAKEQKIGLWKQ